MSRLNIDSILPTEIYNHLLIDHEATEQSALLQLKEHHVLALASILTAHGLSDHIELHLLHRHFSLEEGEAMVHKAIDISGSDGGNPIMVDIAKAVPTPGAAKASLIPLMWMASTDGGLVAYEYGTLERGSYEARKKLADVPRKAWDAFAQDFHAHLEANGLQHIVSLKDKSCVRGGEYVVPSMRALFRIPDSVINLQAGSELVETGWNVEFDGPSPSPEPTDGHVTKTRTTTAGTVAHYHITEKEGPDAFDPKEVDPVYTDRIWQAVESREFFNLCPVVG